MPRGVRYGGGGLDLNMSPLTKKVLGTLVGLYVVQLVLANWVGLPVYEWLAWWPWGSGRFLPWQPLTCYLVNGPRPLDALFDWLFVFFFLTPVLGTLGSRDLVRFLVFTVAISALLGFGLNSVGAIGGGSPFLGLNPLLTGMLVVFGLSRPNARILLMFILPIQAAWLAWGTGLVALLYFLASRDLNSTLWLSGWLAGYIWMTMVYGGGLRRWRLRRKQRQIKKRLSRFEVIEGEGRGTSRPPQGTPPWGRRSDDDDGPIIH